MCGIAGILRFEDEPVERDRLLRMQESLGCRGPDDRGIFTDGRLGFVHTRLSILDPAHGKQPMTLPGRNLTVVFNGEIYNHRALRRELEGKGHRFTTDHCDTEVLLHGYREWVEDLPKKLIGMFAFAIWDGEELFLSRDGAGEKPLYVGLSKTRFIFASTIAAVRAGMPGKVDIDRDALHEYLAYGYTLDHTVIQTIREIEPYGMVRLSPRRADQPPPPRGMSNTPADETRMTALITDAVRTRLEADVPLGCFLSGGIDSSLLAALAQQELKKTGGRLKTFSMSMPEASYDESPWARKVADHIGAEHHELHVEMNIEADLQMLVATMGEPFADSSILPTYWLSKAARQHVKVAISGDGGDELFGGYERYLGFRALRRHAWWLQAIPAARLSGEQKSRSARLRRMVEASRFSSDVEQYTSLVRVFNDKDIRALGVRSRNVQPAHWPYENLDDPADRARWWDFMRYLPGDLLRKVDRTSMAVGLEVRCPFLDKELAEAALSTPMKTQMAGRRTKQLLREVARPYLPADVIERRKMGFAVPIGSWFKTTLRPMVQRWLLDGPHLESIGLKREPISQLIQEHLAGKHDHTHRIFALISLSMWLNWLRQSENPN